MASEIRTQDLISLSAMVHHLSLCLRWFALVTVVKSIRYNCFANVG